MGGIRLSAKRLQDALMNNALVCFVLVSEEGLIFVFGWGIYYYSWGRTSIHGYTFFLRFSSKTGVFYLVRDAI